MGKRDYWMNLYTQLGNYEYAKDEEQKECIIKNLEENDTEGFLKVNNIREDCVRAALKYMSRTELEINL